MLLEFLKFAHVQLVPEDLSLCLKPIIYVFEESHGAINFVDVFLQN